MSSFEARLRLDGDTGPPLGVEVDLTGARMNVKTGNVEVANWVLDEIRVTALEDGFHIRAEGRWWCSTSPTTPNSLSSLG